MELQSSIGRGGPLLVVGLGFAVASLISSTKSASLSTVSVTLSNSRLSFSGGLASGNTVGSSQVLINTSVGAFPSTNSAQLVEGDTVSIGDTDSLEDHVVTDTPTSGTINIDGVLATGDTEAGDAVISTQSATQTVRLTTANAIPNGRFRILVPALADDTMAADGLPDAGYFDFTSSTPTVTCPSDISGYDFVAGTATASAVTVDGTDYHSFECAYSGSGGINTAFDGSSNDAFVVGALINPAPKSGHILGTADSHQVIIQHLDSSFSVQDTTAVAVGVIEAVKVTASVAPQINFKITGVATSDGISPCGNAPSVTTTAATVPLGELSISSFTHAAQNLAVSTNAVNGYVVTAIANDQLGLDGAECTGDATGNSCIPDTVGDAGGITHTVSKEWSSATVKGFGYSLDDLNATSAEPAFEYDNNGACTDTSDGGTCTACDGTGDCFRQFADNEDSQSVVRIMGSVTDSVADNDNIFVCYRAIISTTQAAGNYENYITYTATATF